MPGRIRTVRAVSRETGEITVARNEILPPAGFAQRTRELKASLPDIGDAEERHVHLVCNGCDAVAELDFDDPRYPAGWQERDDGDFCPACARR
jgi:hypothetical protein